MLPSAARSFHLFGDGRQRTKVPNRPLQQPRESLRQQRNSTEAKQKKGKQLLEEMMTAHGGLADWKAQKTAETVLTDEWFGLFGKLLKPWKANPQKMKHQILLDTDISRVEFLDGPIIGEIWGIQYWNT